MTPRTARRTIPVALAALVLLGLLAFLFAKTQSAGYKDQVSALALLRELRDTDARWDIDALRLANDFSVIPAPITDRSAVVSRILQALENGPARAAAGLQLPAIRAAVTEKQAAFAKLRETHARSTTALDAARESLAALSTQAASLRARDAHALERSTAITTQAELLRASLRSTDIEYQSELQSAIEPRLQLLGAAAQDDPQALEAARRAETAVRAFLAIRAEEAATWRKLSLLTIGARFDLAARDLSRTLESSLDEKDRWRVYLVAYAAALLLGVGYLGARVVATQAALREANEELERRVAARTADLERALRQLKESEAALVQSEKMSSLGQLVAGVAHEINTPLAYVKNSVAVVRERLPAMRAVLGAKDENLEDLEALTKDGLHGIEQIAELVANLKNFSRLDRSKVASFNVNEGVRATLLIARPTLRKVDLAQDLGEIPSITCSPSQVNQVLLNLLTNASQAIDKPRGIIRLATRREGADRIAIEVADNGRGIAPDALPRIFDPFFTTKDVGKGTGLGLTIAYKIVSQHGGRIDVRTEVGVGSTFTVVLPINPPAEAAPVDEREKVLA
jgi:two-component system NtrC family sensor kinase